MMMHTVLNTIKTKKYDNFDIHTNIQRKIFLKQNVQTNMIDKFITY